MMDTSCWHCEEPYKSEHSVVCSNCGKPRKSKVNNVCENYQCKNYNVQLDSSENYCDLCGKPTTIGKEIELALGH